MNDMAAHYTMLTNATCWVADAAKCSVTDASGCWALDAARCSAPTFQSAACLRFRVPHTRFSVRCTLRDRASTLEAKLLSTLKAQPLSTLEAKPLSTLEVF